MFDLLVKPNRTKKMLISQSFKLLLGVFVVTSLVNVMFIILLR